jgi:hypothetical protein
MDQALETARYDLFSLEAGARLVWKNSNRGVSLEPAGLELKRGGRWQSLAYADIRTVTLSTARVGASRVIGQCTLTLRTGQRLIITNTNAAGLSDGLRDTLYREFVRDLHRQLVESGAAERISFRSGFSTARITVLLIALSAAALLFVALPALLLLVTRDLRALWVLIGGGTLLAPAASLARSNRPASYDTARPPDLLP